MKVVVIVAVWIVTVVLGVLLIGGISLLVAPPKPVPEPDAFASASPSEAEYSKWIDERDAFSRDCFSKNGVPVFTFGMRLFCVSRTVLVGGGARGEPSRPSP